MTVNGSMAIKFLQETTMNKVKDLVSVNVERVLRSVGSREELYELFPHIGEFLKNIVDVKDAYNIDEEFSLIEPPERFTALLYQANEDFVLGAQSLYSLRYEPDSLSESALSVVRERARRVELSIPTAPPIAQWGFRVWEPDEFLADVLVFLWMEFFVRLVTNRAGTPPQQLSLIGQGGIP